MFTREFKDISKKDVLLAGGKGASLGEMTQAGIPVPNGFVVLSDAFEKFIDETGLRVRIQAILDKVNVEEVHTIENASEEIRAIILTEKMPDKIGAEISNSFKKLGAKFVAVRSSATAEDSSSAAWAGQLDTFLNTSKKNLLENVKKCWASLFTPRAIFYRFEQKLNKKNISVAVVVQKMIQSEESGIAFSVHPVTQDYNQIIIEAGLGLGEAIVSGQITPDSYVINKSDLKIVEIKVNEQVKGLFKSDKGDNEWRGLGERGKKQVLNEKEIRELAEIIIKIENHYGFPCDIEWAKEAGNFYIVQSRPITTLIKKNNPPLIFKKFFTRDIYLSLIEYWHKGEYFRLREYLNGATHFNPLFISNPGGGVGVYYDINNDDTALMPLINFIREKPKIFFKLAEEYEENYKSFLNLIKKPSLDNLQNIFDILIDLWGFMPVLVQIGEMEGSGFDKKIIDRAQSLRSISQNKDVVVEEIVRDLISKNYPNYLPFAEVLKLSEIVSGSFPDFSELNKRKNGFIFFEGNLIINCSLTEFEKEYNLKLNKDLAMIGDFNSEKPANSFSSNSNTAELVGVGAVSGIAKGPVSIVLTKADLIKVKSGDVVVSSMTTPDFISAMKKSSAIVTDEGGVTCHAAIVARELKKPCVIGTKIATQVLHDGDLVEVDADKGEVKILEKAGEKNETEKEKKIFEKFVQLDGPLGLAEIHYNKEAARDIPWANEKFNISPYIFYEKEGKETTWYYDKKGVEWQIKQAGKYPDEQGAIKLLKTGYDKVKKIIDSEKALGREEFLKFIKNIEEIWPWFNYMWWAIHYKEEKGESIEELMKIRKYTEYFTPGFIAVFRKSIAKIYPEKKKFVDVILFSEVLKDKLPSDEELNKRLGWRAYTKGEIYYSLEDFKRKYNIEIMGPLLSDELKGQTAYPGKVQGKVRIIKSREDIIDFKQGDIIVASTTTPDFLPAMKKSAAIISEHGGAICHASITSRELKIPCIVGVKGATHALKDGILVEVDADKGEVRILKRVNN